MNIKNLPLYFASFVSILPLMGITFIVYKMHVILENPSFNLLPKILVIFVLVLPFSFCLYIIFSIYIFVIKKRVNLWTMIMITLINTLERYFVYL